MDYTKASKNTHFNAWSGSKNKVLTKTLSNNNHSLKDIQKLKNEYELLQGLNIQGVRKIIEHEVLNHQHQFVIEHIEGRSLKDFIQEIPLSINEKLDLMIRLTKVLEGVHQEGIIHKDVTPANILVTPDQEVFLTNFGISSRFTLHQPNLGNPEKIEGTLEYISPEQTGRMNRSVDYRTDLYTLGTTFYELLTKRTVFEESDAMALVHAHIAKAPKAPSVVDNTIPDQLSKIILKLLEKNPENRYQSALGLRKDLEKYLFHKEKEDVVTEFKLGQEDLSGKLQIPEKLYGREQERQTILKAFERVKAGAVELTLVAGYSGTGKSVLVNETHRPLAATRGYFVEGKFDQFQRNIPFFAWIQAFKNFVDLLLTENEEVLHYWRGIILGAVGDNGGVLTEVIPNLELVIGIQSAVTQLGGQEAQNRFNYVMQNFVKAITTAEHPLIIFIDDLQWADLASLELLKTLVTDLENDYLLCVGAYRDNEVSTTHPLTSTIQDIHEVSQNINEIKVGNLPKESVLQMLHETLGLPKDEKLKKLNELILSKTQGNAFFIHRFLKNLYEEHLLQFNFERKRWTWQQTKIMDANFTDNVVEFMANKIGTLPTKTQQLLEWAACIGNKFDLNTLQIVAKQEAVQIDLDIAILEGLIFPMQKYQYKFAHDRIQQAAYSLIPENKKQATHLQIGQLLYKSLSEEEQEERIFDITNHYNLAIKIFAEEDRQIGLVVNQKAALKAKASASFDGMLTYIQLAKDLLPENTWKVAYLTTLELYKLLAEALLLNTRFDDLEDLVEEFLRNVQDPIEKAEILIFLVLQKTVEAKYAEAIKVSEEAMGYLDIKIPTQEEVHEVNQKLVEAIYGMIEQKNHVADILQIPFNQSKYLKLVVHWCMLLEVPVYFMGNMDMYVFINSKAMEISLSKGITIFTPKALSNFGFITGSINNNYPLGYSLGKVGFDLARKINSKTSECQSALLSGSWTNQWTRPLHEGQKYNLTGIQTGLETGELQFAMYNVFGYVCNTFASGQKLSGVQQEIEAKYYPLVSKYKNELSIHILLGIRWVINTLSQDQQTSIEVYKKQQNEIEFEAYCIKNDLATGLAIYYTYKAQALYIMQDYAKGFETIMQAAEYAANIFGFVTSFDFNFYTSLILLKQYEITRNEALLETVNTNQTQMKIWADNCSENFLHKYQLLEAERARLAGKPWHLVLELYEQAIENAQKNNFLQDVALTSELCANYLLTCQKPRMAKGYIEEAYLHYQYWEATAKLTQLEEEHTDLLKDIVTSNQANDDSFDTKTILKATHSLSQQVQLKDLIQEILHLLSQNSGANKITFLRKEASDWIVEADQKDGQNLIDTPQKYTQYINLPKQLINYVLRTKEFVLLGDISQNYQFSKDPYFNTENSRSVFVVPIKKHDKVLALLYLENNLSIGVFHQKRYELINALVTQLAISMENTLLYESLENKVNLRTKELQESNKELQVMNEELRQTQEELQTQRDYVEEKNKVLQEFNTKINSSLKVAQTIQEAVLPYQTKLDHLLENYFIINQPKDVVSGDFYWLNEINGKVILVVADCTGHGIPGAFMTLIGANLLDKIIRIRQVTQPNDILNQLHEEVQAVLKQHYTTNNKGMDASVVSLEKKNGQTIIQFSGAKNNFYYYSDGLYELKGDRKSIGGIQDESIRFTNQQLTLPAGGMLYLGSDGLEDQNNRERKKFGRKRLQVLLSNIATLPVDDQKTKIEKTLEHYMQDTEQRDDILWMGIQV